MKGKYFTAGIAPGTSQALKLSSLPSPSSSLLTVVAKVHGLASKSMNEAGGLPSKRFLSSQELSEDRVRTQ